MTNNIPFSHEDVSKPENRINLSLFGLFLVDEFRVWFLKKLRLPKECVIFPSQNLPGGIRTDFVVQDVNDKPIAYIEVETGQENKKQLINFRKYIDCPVISITGLKENNSDLSLEEIYNVLREIKNYKFSNQARKNFEVFEIQIREYVLGHKKTIYESQPISDYMRGTPLVEKLLEMLTLQEDVSQNLYPGEIGIETKMDKGFSLRVYSRIASSAARKSVAVMSQSAGRPEILFPSRKWLSQYLPDKSIEVKKFASLLEKIGCPINSIPLKTRGRMKIKKVDEHLKSIVEAIQELGR